jgi:type IV pilus assembly protein PilV
MTPRQTLRNETGFTLIELMVTLVILSVALLALAGLQVTASTVNAHSKRLTAAMTLVETKLEAIKDTAYATILSKSSTPVVAANMQFTQQVTVTANSPVPTAKTVRVTVTWTEGARSYTVPLSTVISQP